MNNTSFAGFLYKVSFPLFLCALMFAPAALAISQTQFFLTIEETMIPPPANPPDSTPPQQRLPTRSSGAPNGVEPFIPMFQPPGTNPPQAPPQSDEQDESVPPDQQNEQPPAESTDPPGSDKGDDSDEGGGSEEEEERNTDQSSNTGTQKTRSQNEVKGLSRGPFFDNFEIVIDTKQALAAGTYKALGTEVETPLVISITVSLVSVGFSVVGTRISLFT